MMVLLKTFLAIYAVVFIVVVFILRIAIVSKSTKLSAKTLMGRRDGLHGLIGFYFKVLPLFSFMVILMFLTSGYEYLGPINWLEHSFSITAGLFLLITTFLWISVSQSKMGKAWRIGIDMDNQNNLVTQGVFSLSRNPIFLGIKLNALGFFLVLPNALSLAIFIVGSLLIDIQVRLEEDYLTDKYGDAYTEYCSRVGRWV